MKLKDSKNKKWKNRILILFSLGKYLFSQTRNDLSKIWNSWWSDSVIKIVIWGELWIFALQSFEQNISPHFDLLPSCTYFQAWNPLLINNGSEYTGMRARSEFWHYWKTEILLTGLGSRKITRSLWKLMPISVDESKILSTQCI